MSEVTMSWYKRGLAAALNGEIDFEGNAQRAVLLAGSYVPNLNTHEFLSDLALGSNEASGDGYTAGGQLLANKAVTFNAAAGANGEARLTADPTVWTAATVEADQVVIYQDVGAGAGDKRLLGLGVFAGTRGSTDADFTITWHADGFLYIEF